MNRSNISIFILLFITSIFFRCTDPLSADEEAVVKELFRGIIPMGRYSDFWDGKDEEGNFVTEGTYYARLESRDFTYQIEMTANAGGTGNSNRADIFDEGFQPLTNLEQNTPDPFLIRDGTNIPFTIDELAETITVILTIRDRE